MASDPKRQAVLIIGGDKTGDKRFYEQMIGTSETVALPHRRQKPDGWRTAVRPQATDPTATMAWLTQPFYASWLTTTQRRLCGSIRL